MNRRLLSNIFILVMAAGIFIQCEREGKDSRQMPSAAYEQPYPQSNVIKNITWDFKNLKRMAPSSDLWPVTWAADGNLYTSWGDGVGFGATNFKEQWGSSRTSLGFSRIEGPPNGFAVVNIWGGKNSENPATFKGKSSGMLSVKGVFYAWINLQNGPYPDVDKTLAWSADLGASWKKIPWLFQKGEGNFKPEAFLNFGRDYAGARDGFVYFYGHNQGEANNKYLGRVPKNWIKSKNEYRFYAGTTENGNPLWTEDVAKRQPVFTDPNGAGGISVVFNSGFNRYIMTISHGSVGKLGIFDAPEPWGPWTTAAYYNDWGGFEGKELLYHFPTKWISTDGKVMWCIFSSNGSLDSFNLIKAMFSLETHDQQ